ncbi:class I SAM-dependent methyltransferase [Streptomyces sp. HUAS ZL42]|uniref:class I SAM-dependent methyltransferase n=1 Tax=Streptomyces sp. HUAS ZL42 TaxID=3231715 RepID=UPI00345EC5E2
MIDKVSRYLLAVSLRYDEAYGAETKYQSLLGDLCQRIPAGGTVLDLGCGSGAPVARTLAVAGYRVTGIDISGSASASARRHADCGTAAVVPGDARE